MKNEKTIFELIQISYYDFEKPKYPVFNVNRSHVGYFSTLEKAEQEMKKVSADNQKNTFGFLVNEYPIDFSTWYMKKSQRSYLPDGSLWDENLVSEIIREDGWLEEFTGRPAEKMRFNIGDFVEVLHGNTVELEIVANQPWTPEYRNKMHKISETKGYRCARLDSGDDCYYTLDKTGEHSHPSAVTLFPVRFKISKKHKEMLLSDEYYSYRKYYDNQEE